MTASKTSDLMFSEQANHTILKTLGDLKRYTLSIRNRLQSILEDAVFVQSVSAAYGRPLIANERCGSWYIDPNKKHGSAYFKSTDGHTGVWSFSTRRLNLHLLDMIGKHDGCIIVDSTRRGKRMPDALSKTIPIWCSVINRALFPDLIECHTLFTPPQVISSSEYAQIASRLDEFLLAFLALDLDRPTLRTKIIKPIRPIWVTPESYISTENTVFEGYHPIICCTASRRVLGGEISEGGYIQGSGDDTENWALGLTPPIFWTNTPLLLSTAEIDLPELISRLTASSVSLFSDETRKLTRIPPTSTLYITDLETASAHPADLHHLFISLHPEATLPPDMQPAPHRLCLALGPHKLGSRNLRTTLPRITSFIAAHLSQAPKTSLQNPSPEAATDVAATDAVSAASSPTRSTTPQPQTVITVACSTRIDHSVGVALALLCLFYDARGSLVASGGELPDSKGINKLYIRRRLGWIVAAMPEANPSGATLQSVNGFLMPRR